jgi:virulence factor Mce-like protein
VRSKSSTATVVTSPILVGAVTVLVTLVAVFLAYNANEGLPFVPTYDVQALVPNAEGVAKDNEVRIGGKRVGLVKTITAQPGARRPLAVLHMSLDKRLSLKDDTTVTIRPRSPLGLKYVQLVPGAHGRVVPQDGTLPVRDAQPVVALDEVQNTLDAPTRKALDAAVGELGPGLAGRGTSINDFVAQAPGMLHGLQDVAGTLAAPSTRLDRLVRGLADTAGELASVSPQLASTVTSANVTAGALAGVRAQVGQLLAAAPPTEDEAIRTLAVARPVLHDARGLLNDLGPGVKVLPTAAARLHSALALGVPVLHRAPPLVQRLEDTLAAVDDLARDPATPDAVRRLLTTLQAAQPLVSFVTPAQTRCNYLGLYWRNISSALSEGDASGNWLRTLPIGVTAENQPEAQPSSTLHFNPYPHTAGPGQGGECEAGNEPYRPGQQIGNPPGDQGGATEDTSRPPGVSGR